MFSVDEETGDTGDLNVSEIHEALKILLEDKSLYCRKTKEPPTGKIEIRSPQYYFCSNWNNDELIIDTVKLK